MEDAGATPPAGGDVNRGPALLAIHWTECAVAILVVALRIYARILSKTFGPDDWSMILSLILFIVSCILTTVIVGHGGSRHAYYLRPEQIEPIVLFTWIRIPSEVAAIALGKISVALLMLRIMGLTSKWRRWFLYFSMITISVLSVLLCIIAFVQCNPPSTIWTQKPGARCWSGNVQSDFGIFHGSWNALIDFALALLPVTVLWDMQMDIKKKIGLSSLLSLGNLAGIAASVRTSKLIAFLETGDLTWETFDLDAWAASEIFLIILSGSAPTFTPIYKRFRKHNAYITHEQENSGRGFRRTSSYMMDTKKSSPIRQQSSGSGLHTATSTIVAAHIEQDHWSDSDSHTVDASNGLDFYQALELDPGEGAPRPGPSKEQPESNSAMVHGEEIV